MCCTVFGVKEIGKDPYSRCRHRILGKGCGIYETRPYSCAVFNCAWILGEGEEDWRPDKSGVVFSEMRWSGEGRIFVAREAWPKAFGMGRADDALVGMSKVGLVLIAKQSGPAEDRIVMALGRPGPVMSVRTRLRLQTDLEMAPVRQHP